MKSKLHITISEFLRGIRLFLLGPSHCLYEVGCIDYIVDQFLHQSFFIALKNSTQRIFSCHPFSRKK